MIIIKKILTNIAKILDYPIFICVFLFCLAGLLFALPWIFKQRRMWEESAKGSRKALVLRGFTLEKQTNRGYTHLLPFRNPNLEWVGVLDAANNTQASIKITDNLYLIAWKSPEFVRLLEKTGFIGTSIIIRELVAILKITNYCVKKQIGVLRTYKHNYPALQACLVSRFIKIPFIVDISGNYELIRRLTGKTFYFKTLNKLPIIRIFARMLTDWTLGLPLRYANRVLGRNKNNYEHAFALGAPVEKLSLLRISNFNPAFNTYDPEKPPANPTGYQYLLFVGRLAKINFPFDVIDAFNLAAPQLPGYRLVIIGDGVLRSDIERRIKSSAYKDQIEYKGTLSNDIVLNWTAHAKVAVCPFSGSTLVEAMLCAIPVIAYDIEWHAELVIDEYTGYLVPFANISALAEKMVHVVRNYDEAKTIGRRGRDLARVVFDHERICRKESTFYTQALKGSWN